VARQPGTISGLPLVAACLRKLAPDIEIRPQARDGDTTHRFTSRRHPAFAPGFTSEGLFSVEVGGPVGLHLVDHVVGNVQQGRLEDWVAFYETVFGFSELTHFDRDQISTEFSALRSTVVTDGRGITLPLNEPASGRRRSQIQEYLDAYAGPGVQHVALGTADIVATVAELRRRGIRFLTPPPAYYAMARARMGELGAHLPWDELARLGILVDREPAGSGGREQPAGSGGREEPAGSGGREEPAGSGGREEPAGSGGREQPAGSGGREQPAGSGGREQPDGYLLQVFSETLGDRPTLFFEVIQREGAIGFGEGNFKALFEAVEREQARRGNL